MDYSVLMSVYANEKVDYLRTAIDSILNQTKLTNDFVIIEDGLLTTDLENLILQYEKKYSFIHVFRRKENKGLGYSLREGVLNCSNEIIARMDSDDYSIPNRCSIQLNAIEEGYDLVGSNIDEFTDNPENVVATKTMPSTREKIIEYAKYRNPFNHPSVMFKKDVILNVGNYHDFYRLEDYELWVRVLEKDCKCCNIQQSLVRMRVNDEFYKRRGGKANLSSHIKLKKYMLRNNQISSFEFIKGCTLMIGRAYCPGIIKQFLYRKALRK